MVFMRPMSPRTVKSSTTIVINRAVPIQNKDQALRIRLVWPENQHARPGRQRQGDPANPDLAISQVEQSHNQELPMPARSKAGKGFSLPSEETGVAAIH